MLISRQLVKYHSLTIRLGAYLKLLTVTIIDCVKNRKGPYSKYNSTVVSSSILNIYLNLTKLIMSENSERNDLISVDVQCDYTSTEESMFIFKNYYSDPEMEKVEDEYVIPVNKKKSKGKSFTGVPRQCISKELEVSQPEVEEKTVLLDSLGSTKLSSSAPEIGIEDCNEPGTNEVEQEELENATETKVSSSDLIWMFPLHLIWSPEKLLEQGDCSLQK